MTAARTALIKPKRLQPGDRIAAVSPSWGGPGTVPERYGAGKRQLEAALGVEVVEMAHTLAPADWVAGNPKARAEDLMAAFADPSIAGIVASIGGEDSIRLLPYLDREVIRANPKVFLGFSDTTSLHMACYTAGLASFYGPSIMAGFAENGGMHDYTLAALRKALIEVAPIGEIPINHEGWTSERTDWSAPAVQAQRRVLRPAETPRVLQGEGVVRGHLLGGCAEVLEMVKDTAWWPNAADWRGAILFLETSEDAPPAHFIRYWLRNYAAKGILGGLAGILLARPDPQGDEGYRARIEAAVVDVLAEAALTELPVLSGLDFGHTQPMLTLPFGAIAEIDCASATLRVLEAGVV
ncbi:peptidase S66 [Devosia limi DSM 17137]|uniref:Muramoyltetrapeptide carboxypeptidase LdcA (Peptidoglycan recycling) n=1 Tax=Devosia limi DSM 17137 TaxID=1121477 RepID=A0A0F5LMJ9_9HYPH|nr:S66 peptidase family protein [Devosia limi]KKB82897.1 peptidase S66 [Devosia limi DSM 17137]SHF50617.1 Muramoyltetrapeptide carboxypeptidase LdcA (peptidoglycan recycling) [Devosia limi DSM 17137]